MIYMVIFQVYNHKKTPARCFLAGVNVSELLVWESFIQHK